jgi:hypothetical protein
MVTTTIMSLMKARKIHSFATYGPSDGPFFVVRYWRFGLQFQTVRPLPADSPSHPCGQLAKCFGFLICNSSS